MFAIASTAIDTAELRSALATPQAGAFVAFEGWVRDHNEGQPVIGLEYEACETLAINEANKIIAEASERYGALKISCVHRVGELKVGEVAVWVGVVTAHRGEAFAACRFVIDEIKSRLPIWKKETYQDGSSGWVNCRTSCASHTKSKEVSQSR